MTITFEGKTVIVTGASSGIGKAIAIAFGQAGANVVINYRGNRKGAEATQQSIEEAGGKAIVVQADISQEAEVEKLFTTTIETFGALHVLVNNAGMHLDKLVKDMSFDEWQRVLQVNTTGHFLCAREAVRYFEKQPSTPTGLAKGNIIFISSVHDIIPWAGHANYVTSKGGLLMFMKTLAQEVGGQKIRANAISPGAIEVERNEETWSDEQKLNELMKLIPYGRMGKPEDIAKTALWLASDESDYITGTTIYVDGGMTLYPGFIGNG